MKLPQGWNEYRFDETIEVIRGVTFSKSDRLESPAEGYVACLRSGNIQGELTSNSLIYVPLSVLKSDDRFVRRGDTIVSMSNSYELVGKVGYADERHEGMTFGAFLSAFRSDFFDQSFLYHMLRGPAAQTEIKKRASQTVNISNISISGLADIAFSIPPLAEQRRIVAKLDALTTRIARARAELDRVSVMARKSRLVAMASCFNCQSGGVTTLGRLLLGIESGKNMRCEERPPCAGEKGVIKVSAVTWGHFNPNQSKTLPEDYKPPEKARIMQGDLLISRANTLELVGAPVLVEEQPNELFLSDKVLRLVLPEGDKRWVHWFLRSPAGREQIEGLATGNQLSMRNISQDALRRIKLPYPDERRRTEAIIVLEATFARISNIEAEAARARALLDRLESAILAKAFRGELVPQDPNDEPASVLLEHIRAQRAAAPKAKRRSLKIRRQEV